MKFLVDAHFPLRLKQWLLDEGYDTIHTMDLPLGSRTPDRDIMRLADQDARIVITKDKDFWEYRVLRGTPDRLLMVTTGNILNHLLIALFETTFPQTRALFEAGAKVVEVNQVTITQHV